jgi:hypothetical protein
VLSICISILSFHTVEHIVEVILRAAKNLHGFIIKEDIIIIKKYSHPLKAPKQHQHRESIGSFVVEALKNK